MKKQIFTFFVATVALVGCSSNPEHNRQVGTVLGGVAGGVLGSQFGSGSGKTAATIGGTLLGTWVGNKVATSMTQGDRVYYERAANEAYSAPVGESISWSNPESGHGGTITPTREGTNNQTGEYCREFQQTILIDGKTEKAYGTACLQSDGSWRIVN